MKRFKDEFILFQGEYHFSTTIGNCLLFQKEIYDANLIKTVENCCKLCCYNLNCTSYNSHCLVDEDFVLIKMKYFKYYKEWETKSKIVI